MKIVSDLSLTGRPIRRVSMAPRLLLDFMDGALPDGVSFTRAGSATYFDANGVLQTAAADQPRFDHDPVTKAPKGLLIEGSRTNLLLRSNDLTNAAWVKSASIALAGYVVTATDPTHAIYQTVTVTPGTTYTFSFYAQRGTMSYAKYSVFDLTNSINIIAPTSYYASIAGTTLTRVIVAFTAPAGCTTVRVFPLRDSGGTGDITICSGSLGLQVEAGSFPTSYIPTTTAAATRAADQPSITANLGTRDVRVTTEAGVQVLTGQALTGSYWPALTGPQRIRKIEVL